MRKVEYCLSVHVCTYVQMYMYLHIIWRVHIHRCMYTRLQMYMYLHNIYGYTNVSVFIWRVSIHPCNVETGLH